jgi:hypothetical protein
MLQSLAEPLLGTRRYANGTIIAGTYKDGVVQLMKAPANIQEIKVIVTFLDSTDLDPDSVVSKSEN